MKKPASVKRTAGRETSGKRSNQIPTVRLPKKWPTAEQVRRQLEETSAKLEERAKGWTRPTKEAVHASP